MEQAIDTTVTTESTEAYGAEQATQAEATGADAVATQQGAQGERQTTPEDSRQADRRRKLEERHRRELEDTEARIRREHDEQAKALGFNSFSELVAQGSKRSLQDAGVNADAVAALARQAVADQIRNDPTIRSFEEARNQIFVERGIRELNETVPGLNVKTVDDILNLPRGQEISDLVQARGLSFADAYKLANWEDHANQKAKAARQAAYNAGATKGHLEKSAGAGTGIAGDTAVITEETRRMHKMINGWSDKEIDSYYAKKKG